MKKLKTNEAIAASVVLLLLFYNSCGEFKSVNTSGSASIQSQNSLCKNPGEIEPTQLRRLNKNAYMNSLRDILGNEIYSQIEGKVNVLPEEADENFEYSTGNGSTTPLHVDSYNDIAAGIGAVVSSKDSHINKFFPCLISSTSTNVMACVEKSLKDFGLLVFRRPLTTEEVDELKSFFSGTSLAERRVGVKILLHGMFQDPRFLYIEAGNGSSIEGSSEEFYLTDFERASKMSYTLWMSTPDKALLQAAAEGRLKTQDDLQKQAARMLADSKSRRFIRQFVNEWLGLEDDFDINLPEASLMGIKTAGLSDAMRQELLDFVSYIIFEKSGGYQDLLLSREAKVSDTELAKIYGVNSSDNFQRLPAGERAGILTRAAFAAGSGIGYNHIMRGVRLRKVLLCDQLPPPSPEAFVQDFTPEARLDYSLRQYTNIITEPAACVGCHSQINPLGFSLGNYDSLGRYIHQENLFDDSGSFIKSFPVDSRVELDIDGTGQHLVNGGVELSELLARSDKAQTCFSQQLFRYINGRKEKTNDGCYIDDVNRNLKSGGVIQALIEGAIHPTLGRRKISGN